MPVLELTPTVWIGFWMAATAAMAASSIIRSASLSTFPFSYLARWFDRLGQNPSYRERVALDRIGSGSVEQ